MIGNMIGVWFVPMLVLLAYVAVIVYAIALARRLVFASERIAAALERNRADTAGPLP